MSEFGSNMKIKNPKITYILKNRYITVILIILSSFIISFLKPEVSGLDINYEIGKPWQYEKLNAPYEFPINKSDEKIKAEQDSIRATATMVYKRDNVLVEEALARFDSLFAENNKNKEVPVAFFNFAKAKIKEQYERGIISSSEVSKMRERKIFEVSMRSDNNELKKTPFTEYIDLKEAYDAVAGSVRKAFPDEPFEALRISEALVANIVPDEDITEKLLNDKLQKMSISEGLVQKDELIVDNGQIVDDKIFMILKSLEKAETEKLLPLGDRLASNAGLFVICITLFSLLSGTLMLFRRDDFIKVKNMVFVFVITTMFTLITQQLCYYNPQFSNVIPYVMVMIIIRLFFDSYTSVMVYLYTLLLSVIYVPNQMGFIVMQSIAGVVALISLQNLNNRAKMIRSSFLVFISYIVTFYSLQLYSTGTFKVDHLSSLLVFSINLIFLMFTYILVYMVEKIFKYTSNISLVELADMNSELMKKLSEVAPGTFQHSIQVSILATEAAGKIGADVFLIRAGAMYHDIGKINNPIYFTENQGVTNPHGVLSHKESARVIIKHVVDGIALANKYNLPPQIIDFIRTHHGRSTTRYFYNSYCNEHPEEEFVDTEPFTYPGPNPFSKETGILMLADAVEAASRSLKEHTEEGISNLINNIIDNIVSEGLLNDTPLTFKDIKTIKEIFFQKIKIMYHSRIVYPERNKK